MIKHYSLDFYTENSSESLPITVDIDNDKFKPQFLYKLFCISVNSLFLEYVRHNALFYQFKDLFSEFDIYLNELDLAGNVEPVFCNSDEDINRLLNDFDFTITDSATDRPVFLMMGLEAMIKNSKAFPTTRKLKLRYGYIETPKSIYRILCEPVEISVIHNYNVVSALNEFLFICRQITPSFISINKIKIIYEDLTKLFWFIRTTLNKIYNKKILNSAFGRGTSGKTAAFTAYTGGLHVAHQQLVDTLDIDDVINQSQKLMNQSNEDLIDAVRYGLSDILNTPVSMFGNPDKNNKGDNSDDD